MIRDVCTSILVHTIYPKKSEKELVARLIVETYPFLKDPVIDEDTSPRVTKIL